MKYVKIKCVCGEELDLYENLYNADNSLQCHNCSEPILKKRGKCKIIKHYESEESMIINFALDFSNILGG